MGQEIKAKQSASAALTITLAGLASSTAGVGRQSTPVNNAVTLYQRLHIYFKVTTGTNPTVNKTLQFYLLKGDVGGGSENLRTDGAGDADAGLTVVTARLVKLVATDATSDKAYVGDFVIENPGPDWAIAVVHDTAVNLNATAGNHAIRWVGENPEVQ